MKFVTVATVLALVSLAACKKDANGDMVVKTPVVETTTRTDTVKTPDVEVTKDTVTATTPKVEVKKDSTQVVVPHVSVKKKP